MASGSRGRRADAGRLTSLSAADLVAHLNEYPNREYEFVQVALVLGAWERRLAEAEAEVRAADEVADMLRDEIRARERLAAEADAEIRRAAEIHSRLQAEIRTWERRAADAEARLRANASGRHCAGMEENQPGGFADAGDFPRPSTLRIAVPPAPALLDEGADAGVVDVADLGRKAAEAQAEEVRHEEASEIVSCKRKELAVVHEKQIAEEGDDRITLRKRLKKLKLGGGRCLAAEWESVQEPDARNGDVLANIAEARTVQGVADHEPEDPRTTFLEHEWGNRNSAPENGYEDMSMAEKFESKKVAATAVGPQGKDLPNTSPANGPESRPTQRVDEQEPELPKMTTCEQGKGDGGEPENGTRDMPWATSEKKGSPFAMRFRASEASKIMAMPAAATYEPRKSGMLYKMVFKALKENEMKRARDKLATAAALQPNFRCWLRAPLPSESVVAGEGSDTEVPQK